MESKRQRQVAELIKRNFSMVLFEEGRYIYGPEVLVSVTNVSMSSDLSLAKIYVSIYNTEDKLTVFQELKENKQRLKQMLTHRIRRHVRRIPEIEVFIDDTLDEMYRVEKLFDKLRGPEK